MPVVQFDWDDIEDNIDEEFDEHGNSIVEYTTEPGYHGNVESQFRDGVTSTFHHDGLGSTIAVTNDAGDVTDTLAYSAFGNVAHRTGTTEFPFQFVGKKGYYFDTATAYGAKTETRFGTAIRRVKRDLVGTKLRCETPLVGAQWKKRITAMVVASRVFESGAAANARSKRMNKQSPLKRQPSEASDGSI